MQSGVGLGPTGKRAEEQLCKREPEPYPVIPTKATCNNVSTKVVYMRIDSDQNGIRCRIG